MIKFYLVPPSTPIPRGSDKQLLESGEKVQFNRLRLIFLTSPVRIAFAICFHSSVIFANFLVQFSSLKWTNTIHVSKLKQSYV